MNNLTQIQQNAKEAYLNYQQEQTGLSYKKLRFFNVIIKLSKSSLKFSNWAFLF